MESKKEWLSRAYKTQTLIDALEEMNDIDEIVEKKEKLLQQKKEIYDAIDKVHDYEMRAILIRRFILCQSVFCISKEMHYARETVSRKLRKAIDSVEIK